MTTTIVYNPPETYANQSREFIALAHQELEQGDLLQASEKAWGAAAAAIKSVAEMRGWQHYAHTLIAAALWRISREHNRPRLLGMMAWASGLHQNYYEYRYGEEVVAEGIEQVAELLDILEQVKTETPTPFVPTGRRDRQHLGMLDGILDLRGRPVVSAEG